MKNVKMWKCVGSRHFERSPPEADEVRNLAESSTIDIETNHTDSHVFSSIKRHEISHFVRLRRTPFEMTTPDTFPHFHIPTFSHSSSITFPHLLNQRIYLFRKLPVLVRNNISRIMCR